MIADKIIGEPVIFFIAGAGFIPNRLRAAYHKYMRKLSAFGTMGCDQIDSIIGGGYFVKGNSNISFSHRFKSIQQTVQGKLVIPSAFFLDKIKKSIQNLHQ